MVSLGIEIEDSSAFQRVYNKFFERYDHGGAPSNISAELMTKYKEYINDRFDSHGFWFALALAQWETGSLESSVFNKVVEIIVGKTDKDLWQYQDGPVKTQRRIALRSFLNKISRKNQRIRKPYVRPSRFHYKGRIRIESPDQTKYFILEESGKVRCGRYISGSLHWSGFTRSVFRFKKAIRKVHARWEADS